VVAAILKAALTASDQARIPFSFALRDGYRVCGPDEQERDRLIDIVDSLANPYREDAA